MEKKERKSNIAAAGRVLLLAGFLLLIAAVPVLMLLTENDSVSWYENRSLATAPELTAESVLNGDYFDGWDDYFSDHMVGRDTLCKFYTWLELRLLHKSVVNDITVCEDVLLLNAGAGGGDIDYVYGSADSMAEENADFAAYVESLGGTYLYVGVPHQLSYYADRCPSYIYDGQRYLSLVRREVHDSLDELGVHNINMLDVFDAEGRPEAYYYDTDHHYTLYGAFRTYTEIMSALSDLGFELPVLRTEDVTFRSLPNPFLGTADRKLYGLYGSSYTADYFELNEPIAYERYDWASGTRTDAPVFPLPATAEEYTSYNFYMGGDYSRTVIDTGRDSLPNVLVFGDSYTNVLECILYTSFNEMHSLDMRYYDEMSLREYVAAYKPDVVICVRADNSYLLGTGNGDLS